MSNWNKIFKPIVVLCVICIAITGSLAATNKVTAPIIEAARIEAERLARIELLPEADDFTPVEGVAVDNVTAVYAANNGTGYVITSTAKGYGGKMTGDPGHRQQRVQGQGLLGQLRRQTRRQGAGPGRRCGRLRHSHHLQPGVELRRQLRHQRV